jgi:hypothetical protein
VMGILSSGWGECVGLCEGMPDWGTGREMVALLVLVGGSVGWALVVLLVQAWIYKENLLDLEGVTNRSCISFIHSYGCYWSELRVLKQPKIVEISTSFPPFYTSKFPCMDCIIQSRQTHIIKRTRQSASSGSSKAYFSTNIRTLIG